jgi:hypothetical protein
MPLKGRKRRNWGRQLSIQEAVFSPPFNPNGSGWQSGGTGAERTHAEGAAVVWARAGYFLSASMIA